MRIKQIELLEVALPLRRPHRYTGLGPWRVGNYLIVKVHAEGGSYGLGEAPVIPTWGSEELGYFGEAIPITEAVIKELLEPAIKGMEPYSLQLLMDRMDKAVVGYPYAKAAIDMALHDLVGRELGIPVHQLLGGLYRERIPIAHSIGLLEPEEAADEAREVVKEGVRTLKLKVGQDARRDLEVVRKVREAVGDDIEITVDANGGYLTAKRAIPIIREMERYSISLVEQPVPSLEEMAKVAKVVDTPIMADESAWRAQDLLRIKELGAADAVSIYTTKPGGLRKGLSVVAMAEALGFPCNLNGSIETGVGNAANLHLAAVGRPITLACVVPVTTIKGKEQTKVAGVYYTDDVIREPFKYEDGHLLVPKRPGLGVELDPKKLEEYGKVAAA